MKSRYYKFKVSVLFTFISGFTVAQQPSLQYFRTNDKDGIHVFEPSKNDTVQFRGIKVRVGGDFAMQFQGMNQSNDLNTLVNLGVNFNLPTANLNLDVQLLQGVRMHLRTFLSSRHHNDVWIKGGNVQFDNLDFVKPGFLEGVMKYTRLTIGMDEFNYGDAHFRRTDNARAIFNPFVGNYIMDAFSTEAFGELTFQFKGLIMIGGLTNGKLNQSVVVDENSDNQPSIYGKLGYDKQLNSDLRIRVTGSFYYNNGTTTGTWLYGGDRAGSRYYNVLHTVPDSNGVKEGNDFDGRYNARFTKITAFQINPFIKYKGLEFFGIYELSDGHADLPTSTSDKEGAFTQLAAELLFRFGKEEKFYFGGRYNSIFGKTKTSETEKLEISRINIGAGWFISKNILMKMEYVQQNYTGNGWTGRFSGAEFHGVNFEAVISF